VHIGQVTKKVNDIALIFFEKLRKCTNK